MTKKLIIPFSIALTLLIILFLGINNTSPNVFIQTFNTPLYDFEVSNLFSKYHLMKTLDNFPQEEIEASIVYGYNFSITVTDGKVSSEYVFNKKILIVSRKNLKSSTVSKTFYRMNDAYYMQIKKILDEELKRHTSYQRNL